MMMTTLINDKEGWIYLCSTYQQTKFSMQFLTCIDAQLTTQYLALGCTIPNRLYRLQSPDNHRPVINYGPVSTLELLFSMPQIRTNVTIAWQSKSGRVYHIDDEDIDCNDLQCYFIIPDEEKWRRWGQLPNKALLFLEGGNIDCMLNWAEKTHGVKCSAYFIDCANQPLTTFFEKSTGIKVNKNIKLTGVIPPYQKGLISSIGLKINVMDYSTPVKMCWRSKSGVIYSPTDQDFDASDIEYWLEDLNVPLYMKELNQYKNIPQLPFALKNLNYQLTINLIQIECSMEMVLKPGMAAQAKQLLESIYLFIGQYNQASEKTKRRGMVHNYYGHFEDSGNTGKLHLQIDVGTAGSSFFKQLFTLFNNLRAFESVTVD